MEVCYGSAGRPSRGFRCGLTSDAGPAVERSRAGSAAAGAGRDLQRWRTFGGGRDRRCWIADRARLGSTVQYRGSGRACYRQGARQPTPPRRGATGGVAPDRRGWPESGSSWRRALAPGGLGAMALGGVPHFDRQADLEPGAAPHGLPQAVGPAAASRQGR